MNYQSFLSSNNNDFPSRLPKTFYPTKYSIILSFQIETLTYSCSVTIDFKSFTTIPKSTSPLYLVLNAAVSNYTIKTISVESFDIISDEWYSISDGSYTTSLPNSSIENPLFISLSPQFDINPDNTFRCTINLNGPIPFKQSKDGLVLSFQDLQYEELFSTATRESFMERWKDNMNKYSFSKENKLLESLCIFSTNEPVNLRMLFPCFDEPVYKSVFSLQIKLEKQYVEAFKQTLKCISNSDLISVDTNNNNDSKYYTFIYADTPVMSAYLFTFVIGNYDFIETTTNTNLHIRVFTPLKRHHDGALALDIAMKSINFYSKYFDIPFYMNKLDLISVNDFPFRAMECLGCIVFLDSAMLFGHFQSFLEKKLIVRTISHEISHMWFGDLVTMEWWNDIWLNEGFARILEYLCLNDILSKEYSLWDNFLGMIYFAGLRYDTWHCTHPVVRNVNYSSEINEIFDTISYAKGASLIRMLMCYLGEDVFQQGLRKYLKTNAYGNTTTEMLWDCFDEVVRSCNKTNEIGVKQLMNPWLYQQGFPIIDVSLVNENGTWYIKLSQRNSKGEKHLWPVPLFIKTKHKSTIIILTTQSTMIDIVKEFHIEYCDLVSYSDYFLFNEGTKGFYVTLYSPESFDIFIQTIIYNYESSYITASDIFSIMVSLYLMKQYNNLFKVIKDIGTINSYLLLEFLNKHYYSLLDLFLKNNDKTNQNLFREMFINLVDSKLKESLLQELFIYNDETSKFYLNQYDSEFKNEAIFNLFILDDCISKEQFDTLLTQFKQLHVFSNKNLRGGIWKIMIKYSVKYCDISQQKEVIDIIFEDYKSIVNINSQTMNINLSKAFLNLETCSNELVEYFIDTHLSLMDTKMRHSILLSVSWMNNTKAKEKLIECMINVFRRKYNNEHKEQSMPFVEFLYEQIQNKENHIMKNICKLFRQLMIYSSHRSKYEKEFLQIEDNVQVNTEKFQFVKNHLFPY